jgi:hypothetical protein
MLGVAHEYENLRRSCRDEGGLDRRGSTSYRTTVLLVGGKEKIAQTTRI